MIGELADTAAKRLAEFRQRKQRYEFRRFRDDERDFAISQGWELQKENKHSLRFQKIKSIDERLENEIWCLLYTLGYSHLNIGRRFEIQVAEHKGDTVSKQIDVFAYDDETIVVAECKASHTRQKRSFAKDILELDALRKPISDALRKHFNGEFEQKIIWLFVTKNIEWVDNDKVRAQSANINVIRDDDLLYFQEISGRIGRSARYQFHAEFLANSKALKGVDVLASRTRLGRYDAYLFFSTAGELLPISYVNHRGLRDPDSAPTYQRLIQRDRLKKIAEFIKGGGYFPNSIIVNFKKPVVFNKIRSDDESCSIGILTLPDTYRSVWIIDGQHRLYGYAELDDDCRSSPLPILALNNASNDEETRLFSDINSKQKTVQKKLLDEITGDMKLDSPDKREQLRAIAVRALDLMRHDVEGPLYGKIAEAEFSKREAQLTVPYLTDALIQSGILGRFTKHDGTSRFLQGPLYWSDPREAVTALATFLSGFLDVFRRAQPERWDAGKEARFASNTGVAGLIRFAGDLIPFMADKEGEDPRTLHAKVLAERVELYLQPVATYFATANDDDLGQRFATPFGAGGPALFQFRLRELTHESLNAFSPSGFEDELREHSQSRVAEADRKIRVIQECVQGFVLNELKKRYGLDDYLERAVENKELLKKAYEKRLDDDANDRKELSTYLDFLDLRKIVETPKNWDYFRDSFDIQLPDEKKGRSKYVTWFDEINKIRRIPAHPFNRAYSDAEVSTLEYVYSKLADRGIVKS